MGHENECVNGKYEGLYYVNYDYLHIYRSRELDVNNEYEYKLLKDIVSDEMNEYVLDPDESDAIYSDFIRDFQREFTCEFTTFNPTNNYWGTVMENNLFTIDIVDNEWGIAIKLLQKEDVSEALQKRYYLKYLNGIQEYLLYKFEEIGEYGGAWTHGTIRREDIKCYIY